MASQTINGYVVGHTRGVLTLTKGSQSLQLNAGEVDSIRQLLNIALGMQSLPALPPQIRSGRWSVAFNENDTLALGDDDGKSGALSFKWTEGDELILTLDAAQAIALNAIKLGLPL